MEGHMASWPVVEVLGHTCTCSQLGTSHGRDCSMLVYNVGRIP